MASPSFDIGPRPFVDYSRYLYILTAHIYPRRAGYSRRWASFRQFKPTHQKHYPYTFANMCIIIIVPAKGRRHARVGGEGVRQGRKSSPLYLPIRSILIPDRRSGRPTIPKQANRQNTTPLRSKPNQPRQQPCDLVYSTFVL